MIAKNAIDEIIPFLKPTDSVRFAIELMEEFKVYHLPVVANEKLFGIVSESQLLDIDENICIENLAFPLLKIAAQEHIHIFDVMKMIEQSSSTILPVIDKEENFKGIISPKSLLKQLNKFSFAKEVGGIFVLEVAVLNYSLSEITRIIESNKSAVLSIATLPVENDIDKIQVIIKVNTLDLTFILASFERYEYTIVNIFHQAEQIDQLKERYDSLMHYLNI